jgi:dihydropteroate synthase
MQHAPHYDDPVGEAVGELLQQVAVFLSAGVSKSRIVIDPGIGFAKRFEDNIAIMRGLRAFVDTGYPVLIGTSRKAFVGQITGRPVDERMWGSLGSVAAACINGAKIFRVHDVAETRDCLRVLAACLSR